MRTVFQIFAVVAVLLSDQVAAETYRATAPSEVSVEVGASGLVVHQRSVRYEVYGAIPEDIRVGVPFENRLATIATVSGYADDELTSTIEVSVDALVGGALRRISVFSDAGSEAALSGPYFVTTQHGCCSPLTRHHVRDIETGKLLFTATGAGAAGLMALMTMPDRHPTVARWAAFEGHPGGETFDPSLLGILRYGSRGGMIDAVAVRMDLALQPADISLGLAECGALLWLESGGEPKPGEPQRPAAGGCFQPQGLDYAKGLFGLERAGGAVEGFGVEMSLDGTIYATIPVAGDHLDVAHAHLAPGISLGVVRQ